MSVSSSKSVKSVDSNLDCSQCRKLSSECLLDGFLALYEECCHENLARNKNVSIFLKKYNEAVSTAKSERVKVSDFDMKAVIGRGHFGEVHVVNEKRTGEVYAMKILRKTELLSQPEISFYVEERDIMAQNMSLWITQLHFAFQDSINLYLVMDFHAGGDLLSLLRRNDDILEEKMARFYAGEMVMAINSLHTMGYIHRDIKPENVLLDQSGHVKLADFGSAAKLDTSGKVSAHMPVGTPDYVAPELLLSMSRSQDHIRYGPEVDWWSLGICTFEMLFGRTPFTNEHSSTASTYANIMDFEKKLNFPNDSDVSVEAKDFIKQLLSDSRTRLGWPDVKFHSFFSYINLETIRENAAVYVPSVSGLDDTSNFDEVEKVQHQPDIQALMPQRDFSGRDLPFVGFTFSRKMDHGNSACTAISSNQASCTTSVLDKHSHDVLLLAEKNAEIKRLRCLLEKERKNWNGTENHSEILLNNLNSLNSQIHSFEDELLEMKLEEMKGEVILLESELEKVSSQLRSKELLLAKTQAALDQTSQQLQSQQMKLDKERQKSREDQHKDLMLLELRSETWESVIQEKQATIDKLKLRISELEELLRAYEDSEERQVSELDQLQQKMNASLPDMSSTHVRTDLDICGSTDQAKVELDNFHHKLCPSNKKLTLHVTLKAGHCSFLDNRATLLKLQELEKMVDKYAERAREWQEREEELTASIVRLQSDNEMLTQKERMGRKVKDSLMDNVTSYQQEVQTQKALIKELQERIRTYLNRSIALSDRENNFKELQASKLELEAELMSLKEESERTRQTALHKTSQIEEAIRKLEEQRDLTQDYKKRYDCQTEVTEEKINALEEELSKALSNLQRLERREATLTTQVETLQGLLDERNLELEKLERRNMDSQTHLQQLQQRNSELQIQVESLQKASFKDDESEQSKAEFKFQITRLEQQNRDLERRVTSSLRDRQSQDDTIRLLEREKERLMKRIERFEVCERDRRDLEMKMEKMFTLERDNRRLMLKLEQLHTLEKSKLNLEEKLDRLQLDLRKEKLTVESLTAERKILETKLAQLANNKTNDSNEEFVQLKLKVSLLDAVEKERHTLENELSVLKQEKSDVEKQMCALENELCVVKQEKSDLEKAQLEKQSKEADKFKILEKEDNMLKEKLAELMREKVLSDEHVTRLKMELDRLESKLQGSLAQNKSQLEICSLSSETDRLKKLVDKLDKSLDCDTNRNNAKLQSSLIEKLQREKSDLQKQVEHLEREANRNVSAKSSQVLRQEGRGVLQVKQEYEKKMHIGELEATSKEISIITKELAEKDRQVTELKSMLEIQTASLAELRSEVEELMKTENSLLEQLEKEAWRAKSASEEKEKLSAQLQQKLTEDVGSNADLSAQIRDLQHQLKESQQEMEIRKGASEVCGGDIPAYLRHELNESNLALSEARSLLAASKRQELELRNRIDKLQKILDNKAVENVRYLQNSQDAVAELKSLKSQHGTLQLQYKVMEDKYNSLQKERGSNTSETVRLTEEVRMRQEQYQMERKKVEQLSSICQELQEQVKDMEAVISECRDRETEWENIRKTYERAVNERETQLEGATQQLQVVSMAKCEASERMSTLKEQQESMKALHRADVEKLNHTLREEMAKVKKLSSKIAEMEEKDKLSAEVYESQMKKLNESSQKIMRLKEELTESLTENSGLRKEIVKLKKHLEEAMEKFELIIGEKVSLENFAETLQGLHFLDKYKFESTIGQQMKLIDYLQYLYTEHTGKKKKSKMFGVKTGSKDGSLKLISRPLSCSDVQACVEQEKTKLHHQQEHIDRVREVHECAGVVHKIKQALRLKQPDEENQILGSRVDRVQATLSVRVDTSAMNAFTYSPATQTAAPSTLSHTSTASSLHSRALVPRNPVSRKEKYADSYQGDQTLSRGVESAPTPQRMHHNIPHRFATGLNTRATKCGLCLGTVYFVRQASKCQECSLVVHPKCAASVPATCGLPTEYVRHFALMMSHINGSDGEQDCLDFDNSYIVRMKGWLKVPRVGKTGWENRYCVLEDTLLTLYLSDTDGNPVDSFDLNPMDADVSVHSAVTIAELSNTAPSDLYYILRLDQDPVTTCWPGRYLYLMTSNFQEKQRWVASVEAVVKSVQCKSGLHCNKSQMLTVLSLKDADQKDFNCSLILSPQLILIGTDDGLYAFNPETLTSKHSKMTQLTGFGSVHQMALAKGVDLIILLTGPERRLVMLESKLVKCRMSQTLGGETMPFSFRMLEGLHSCTVFDVGLWNSASYLCVGTPTKVYLMKYNQNLAMYCVRKEFPSSEPCSCVCIAENYAIIGTERFYKISLEHPSLLDFVDRQDSSLAFAAYGAANHSSFPLAVVKTSPDDLPLEFLLCFHEFGVFVDHYGQRSRVTDVKWSGLPLAFAFIEPFLYVTYTNTVQATVIPTDRALTKGRQTVMDIQSPRYLGPAPGSGCVYVSSSDTSRNVTEIISIRGQETFSTDSSSNREKFSRSATMSSHKIQFPTAKKTLKCHQLHEQSSVSSLGSNSSGSTFSSLESGV